MRFLLLTALLASGIVSGLTAPARAADDDVVRDDVTAALKADIANPPAIADQKTNDAVVRTVTALYPCPPPGSD